MAPLTAAVTERFADERGRQPQPFRRSRAHSKGSLWFPAVPVEIPRAGAGTLCWQPPRGAWNLDLEGAGSRASWSLLGQVSRALDRVKTPVFWEGGVPGLGIYGTQGSIDAGEGRKLWRCWSLSVLR